MTPAAQIIRKSVLWGLAGAVALLGFFFVVVSLVSGWSFSFSQFSQFWYFIISLAIGFGVQIGLYTYLKSVIHQRDASGRVLAVSGTTSAAAMISCCAHYLANILPVIGAAGIISAIGQYQAQLFWVGLAFNVAGIFYISQKVIKFHSVRSSISNGVH